MTLKYIESITFRVIMPSGEFKDVRIPIEETPGHLLARIGLSEGYEVLHDSGKLPLNEKFCNLKVGKVLTIKKKEKKNNGMDRSITSAAKGLHRHITGQQKGSKHKLG